MWLQISKENTLVRDWLEITNWNTGFSFFYFTPFCWQWLNQLPLKLEIPLMILGCTPDIWIFTGIHSGNSKIIKIAMKKLILFLWIIYKKIPVCVRGAWILEFMFTMIFLCWNQFACTYHLCFNKNVMWWWEKAWRIGMFLWVLFPEAAAGEYWRVAKSALLTFFFFFFFSFPETKCITSVMQITFKQLWGLNMDRCFGKLGFLYMATELWPTVIHMIVYR